MASRQSICDTELTVIKPRSVQIVNVFDLRMPQENQLTGWQVSFLYGSRMQRLKFRLLCAMTWSPIRELDMIVKETLTSSSS